MTNGNIWLVTGASRGIGLGIVKTLLLLPGYTVIAAVHELTKTSLELLQGLPKGQETKLLTVKIDSSSESDALDAVETLRREHGLTSIDVVLAVAGVNQPRADTVHTTKSSLEHQFSVNTVAPLLLFQSTLPLLRAAQTTPKFFVISSIVSSMGLAHQFPHASTAYGASKAALNYTVGRIHYEHPSLVVGAIHPGWVQTAMGNEVAVAAGIEKAPTSVEESVQGIILVIDRATRKERCTFVSYDGSDIPW